MTYQQLFFSPNGNVNGCNIYFAIMTKRYEICGNINTEPNFNKMMSFSIRIVLSLLNCLFSWLSIKCRI